MKNILKFGVITDIHYADVDETEWYDFRGSLAKTREAIEDFNNKDLDFVVILGDFVDFDPQDYDPILAEVKKLDQETLLVIGNHDYMAFSKGPELSGEIAQRTLGLEERYYSREFNGYRVIVLDTNEGIVEAGDHDAVCQAIAKEHDWQDRDIVGSWLSAEHIRNGWIFEDQQEWLKTELRRAEAADEKVIIFGHTSIYPEMLASIRNARDVLKILAPYRDRIAMVGSGHLHQGSYTIVDGLPFVSFKGMLLKGPANYSIVDVNGLEVEVHGRGIENHYKLKRIGSVD